MATLELLQLQNEHNDNFFAKGEDFLVSELNEVCDTIKNDKREKKI